MSSSFFRAWGFHLSLANEYFLTVYASFFPAILVASRLNSLEAFFGNVHFLVVCTPYFTTSEHFASCDHLLSDVVWANGENSPIEHVSHLLLLQPVFRLVTSYERSWLANRRRIVRFYFIKEGAVSQGGTELLQPILPLIWVREWAAIFLSQLYCVALGYNASSLLLLIPLPLTVPFCCVAVIRIISLGVTSMPGYGNDTSFVL